MLLRSFAALTALATATSISAQATGTAPKVDFSTSVAAAGSWSYRGVPGGSEARFVDTTGTARLVLRCTKASRQISLSHTSAVAAPSLLVWTSSASRNLPARFEPNAMRVTAELAAFDVLLDAIAFSRGRIAVMMGGGSPLVVPAWPEAARTIEDCRI